MDSVKLMCLLGARNNVYVIRFDSRNCSMRKGVMEKKMELGENCNKKFIMKVVTTYVFAFQPQSADLSTAKCQIMHGGWGL